MQIFKCAMQILRAHLLIPLIYIVGFSFMSILFVNLVYASSSVNTFEMDDTRFTVIDRDKSALSQGITDFLSKSGTEVSIPDDSYAMQEAVARCLTQYMLIIPEGYGEKFAQASRTGGVEPQLDAVYSYISIKGVFTDQYVFEYLGLVRALFAANPSAKDAQIVDDALSLASEKSIVSVIENLDDTNALEPFVFYLVWCSFALFAGVLTCVSIILRAMNNGEARNRTLVAPISYTARTAQMALACFVVAVLAWAWTFALGLVVYNDAAAELSTPGLVCCALSMLIFCMTPLALGLIVGHFRMRELETNAIAIFGGQIISFFSGAWIPFDMLSKEVQDIAHWLPGYWYKQACEIGAYLTASPSAEALVSFFQHLGALALFGIALLVVSIIIGKLRVQTSSATSQSTGSELKA